MKTPYYKSLDLKKFKNISDWSPDLGKKFFDYYNSVFEEGALSSREKSLIALAVAHTVQCPYWCITRITVRVTLHRQATIGFLEIPFGNIRRDSKNLVVITLGHSALLP